MVMGGEMASCCSPSSLQHFHTSWLPPSLVLHTHGTKTETRERKQSLVHNGCCDNHAKHTVILEKVGAPTPEAAQRGERFLYLPSPVERRRPPHFCPLILTSQSIRRSRGFCVKTHRDRSAGKFTADGSWPKSRHDRNEQQRTFVFVFLLMRTLSPSTRSQGTCIKTYHASLSNKFPTDGSCKSKLKQTANDIALYCTSSSSFFQALPSLTPSLLSLHLHPNKTDSRKTKTVKSWHNRADTVPIFLTTEASTVKR
ncbi:hypothetical protein HDK77DRAFT_446761 [Phyllosticta capitalensis]